MRRTALLITCLSILPGSLYAQAQKPAVPLAERKVSLVVEDVTLSTAIKSLMRSVDTDCVIDDELQDAVISASLKGIKFGLALDVLCTASSVPVIYEIKHDIYVFHRKPDPTPTPVAALLP